MTNLILMLLLGAAWIWGVKCLFTEMFILGPVANRLRSKLPGFITKPLFDCPPCMSSIHGTLVYWYMGGDSIPGWIFYCVALCGVNYMLKLNLFE